MQHAHKFLVGHAKCLFLFVAHPPQRLLLHGLYVLSRNAQSHEELFEQLHALLPVVK